MLKTSLLSLILLLGCTPNLQATPTIPNSPTTMVYDRSRSVSVVEPEVIANKTDAPKIQSANLIIPKTAKFTWGKPGGDLTEYREAKITYPTITKLDDKALQDKIQESISLNSAFGRSLADMEADFKESQWLTELGYTVNYNDNNLLSITYSGMGMGAYPSRFVRYRSVNLTTGSVLRAHHLFKTEALGAIALQVDKQLQAAIKTQVAELDKPDYKDIDPKIFSAHRFRIKHLNDFTLTPEGIIFHYEFGFPHAILAIEPKGDFLMTYEQLKPYLKPGSPLEAVVMK